MPNIKDLTYRELHDMMADLNKINAYVAQSDWMLEAGPFHHCLKKMDKAEDRETRIITPENYVERQHNLATHVDIVLLLYPYFCYQEEQNQRNTIFLISKTSSEDIIKNDRCYFDPTTLTGNQPHTNFYTKLFNQDNQEITSESLADFRLFYGSYALWKHGIATSHIYSGQCAYTNPQTHSLETGRMIISQGLYKRDSDKYSCVFNSLAIHQECCAQVRGLIPKYYTFGLQPM